MKILYISSACFPENKKKIDDSAKIKLQDNIIIFHNSILKGIAAQDNIFVESLIGLPISIKTNKKIFWKKTEDENNNIKYIQFGFINLPILKQKIISLKMFNYIKRYISNNLNDKIVIIYDASFVSVMPQIIKLVEKNHIEAIGIFADIYDYMYDVQRKSNKSKLTKKIYRRKMKRVYDNTEKYIFLTEYMNKLVNKQNKPYIIMEGIYEDAHVHKDILSKNEKIIYARWTM